MLDPDRYPHLAAYLAGLPHGLESYPRCESKGSLLSSSLAAVDPDELIVGLPEPLVELVRSPPPMGVWVPAVHTDAIFFAVCDLRYPTADAVLEWTYERTMRMSKNAIYSAIMRVPGPRLLLKMGARAHGLIQRGTDLTSSVDEQGAEIVLSFPARLHVGLNLVANVALWRAAVEITGGRNVACEMTSSDDTEARYRITFEH